MVWLQLVELLGVAQGDRSHVERYPDPDPEATGGPSEVRFTVDQLRALLDPAQAIVRPDRTVRRTAVILNFEHIPPSRLTCILQRRAPECLITLVTASRSDQPRTSEAAGGTTPALLMMVVSIPTEVSASLASSNSASSPARRYPVTTCRTSTSAVRAMVATSLTSAR